jgi:hypothetical protein
MLLCVTIKVFFFSGNGQLGDSRPSLPRGLRSKSLSYIALNIMS